MSVHVIYYQGGAKMMRHILSRPEYLALRNSGEQIFNVAAARSGDAKAKQRLVQMNYSCLPNEDGSLKGSKRAANTVGMDIDWTPSPLPDEGEEQIAARKEEWLKRVPELVLAKKDELGLMMLERSASKGYHLVFKRRPGLSQEENLRWASELLGVDFDKGAKDITRVFFTTTASEEDLIYLDDEIFSLSPDPSPVGEGGGAGAEKDSSKSPRQGRLAGAETANPEHRAANERSEPPSPTGEGTGVRPGLLYHGVSYATIVSAWLGDTPVEAGDRHRTSLVLADHLRYITDDDPVLIEQILRQTPFVDEIVKERGENVAATVKSAREFKMYRSIPKRMQEAIDKCLTPNPSPTKFPSPTGEGLGVRPGSGVGLPPLPTRLPKLIALLISRTPDIYKPAVAHAVFPSLGAHLHRVRFPYIDNVEHEATLMNVLMAGTGAGKDCISMPINRIMADIRVRDEENLERERQWKREVTSKGANKDKRQRPEGLVIQEIDADMTNPAFVMRMAEADGHFLYTKMNEIEQFDALRGSGRGGQQFQIMCLSFDPGNRYGQTRVGVQSVTEKVTVRFNWNASTTILKGQRYFRSVLTDGPISRINFCTIPEREIGAEMPVYGTYDAAFDEQLRPYIENLVKATGRVECKPAIRLAKRLVAETAEQAVLTDDRVYENLSFRANVIAYLKACVLYVANGMKWSRDIEDFVRWSLEYDLACKMMFFGEAIREAEEAIGKPKQHKNRNLLELLGETFTVDDVVRMRQEQGLKGSDPYPMLRQWQHRGYIEYIGCDKRDRRDSYKKLKYLNP